MDLITLLLKSMLATGRPGSLGAHGPVGHQHWRHLERAICLSQAQHRHRDLGEAADPPYLDIGDLDKARQLLVAKPGVSTDRLRRVCGPTTRGRSRSRGDGLLQGDPAHPPEDHLSFLGTLGNTRRSSGSSDRDRTSSRRFTISRWTAPARPRPWMAASPSAVATAMGLFSSRSPQSSKSSTKGFADHGDVRWPYSSYCRWLAWEWGVTDSAERQDQQGISEQEQIFFQPGRRQPRAAMSPPRPLGLCGIIFPRLLARHSAKLAARTVAGRRCGRRGGNPGLLRPQR